MLLNYFLVKGVTCDPNAFMIHGITRRDTQMSRKPSETVQLKLRFPERLRQRIESAAARDERSMNAEIVRRLEQSFQKEDLQANQARLAEAAATTAVEKLLVVTEGKIASHRKDQEIGNGRAPTGEHVLDKGKP
jgi:hypothetical protein